MNILENYKVLLWDFDGVIMDSMPIRSKGFEVVLEQYPKEQVEELLTFHKINGGLSRYFKFRYFFEEIRKEPVTEDQVLALADDFSKIMLGLLMDEKLLITDSVSFIKSNYQNYEMHIVSGSDGKELRQINDALGLSPYFRTINGSPTPKKELVANILEEYQYPRDEVILIGDSINDYEAAQFNQISFAGYNEESLKTISENYIEQFNIKVSK
ncbi:Haloacid dehalogenase-like hydrolase [Pedobacter sp. BAL39]|uniref:HAD family hydrolase n=1 Tax=Pedobacter sp. BAL39 TaxID=391596 RepID=UPI0001559470|nr:HAD hydrolase-like protein [Pedobacter sp. BAL39]EDM34778.1 Haloacid dehalogenase-like hydrolase [Pedobacter sp. BAL39]